jgi:transcriptional regulator with GAF, ATPase, and Fis domain
MEEIISFEQENGALPNIELQEPGDLAQKVLVLKDLALALLNEVQTLRDDQSLQTESCDIDFYDEVRRFEIELINRALRKTGGHQMRAAHLLNVKVTTLNSKIKRYNIRPEAQLFTYPFAQASVEEIRRRAS